jgi:hypothetical protein
VKQITFTLNIEFAISHHAPSERRFAALGAERSVRPSKVADRAADDSLSMYPNANPPSQKFLIQNL